MGGAMPLRPFHVEEENKMATYNEQLQRIVDDYIQAGEEWPATVRQIGAWRCGRSVGNLIQHPW